MVLRKLEKWRRRRLRTRATQAMAARSDDLCRLGAIEALVARAAGQARSLWHNRLMGLNRVLTPAYFDRLGVPRFCGPQLLTPHGAEPHAGWCGRGAISKDRPLSRLRMARHGPTGEAIDFIRHVLVERSVVLDAMRNTKLPGQTTQSIS